MKKNTRDIALIGMLGAAGIVLGYCTIQLGEFVKIGFSEMPNEIMGWLFGPVVSGIFGGIMDLLKYMMKPTGPFFPGFTISAIVGSVIYGIFFYKKELTLKRIFFAQIINVVIVQIFLNTWWLSILYETAFFALLPLRILKCIIMLPIDVVLFYVIIHRIEGLFKILKSS